MVRFYNARILDIYTGKITSGSLITKGSKIFKILKEGESCELDNARYTSEIDCGRSLLIPAFKNAHSHSPMTVLRGAAEDMVLMDWLYKVIFPMEARLTESDIYWGTKLAIMEMLSSGISATFDMYFFTPSMAKAFIEAGFKACFCSSVSGGHTSSELHKCMSLVQNEYETINSLSPLVRYYAGMHAEYTASDELVKELSKFVNDKKIPFFTHMSEAVGESEGCIQRHGMTPAAYFASSGLWNYGGGVYHAVHVTDDDIALMKKHNISVAINACCNAKIASGIAPVLKYIQNVINVGVGTDGSASNNSLSMFKEMYTLVLTQRLGAMKPDVMSGFMALQAATMGSARLMGLDNSLSLSEGQDADITLIDTSMPNLQPECDNVSNLVYSASSANVKLTMVNGKILYKDGEYFIDVPLKDVIKHVNEIRNRINL